MMCPKGNSRGAKLLNCVSHRWWTSCFYKSKCYPPVGHAVVNLLFVSNNIDWYHTYIVLHNWSDVLLQVFVKQLFLEAFTVARPEQVQVPPLPEGENKVILLKWGFRAVLEIDVKRIVDYLIEVFILIPITMYFLILNVRHFISSFFWMVEWRVSNYFIFLHFYFLLVFRVGWCVVV